MPTTTPLTDAINALTQYANETTGASDTTLSDAVGTLVAGYGGGGGISVNGIATGTEPSGAIEITSSTMVANAFANNSAITSVHSSCPIFGGYAFQSCTSLKTAVFTNLNNASNGDIPQQGLSYCALEKVDISGSRTIQSNGMRNNASLTVLILRKTAAVVNLQNIAAFTSTPFASGGTGGTLYVPNALKSSYQSASNWSTILGYENNSIQAIEGSYYETHYADGTPIE